MNYLEFHKAFESRLCPKIWIFKLVSKRTLEARIRRLMEKAIQIQNHELAQVACDLACDEVGNSLLHDMDRLIRTVKSDMSGKEQRALAMKKIKISSLL